MTKTSPSPDGEAPPTPLQRLTPRALLEVKRLSDPQIHPDGFRVAFTVQEADFEESRWVSHVWITEYAPPEGQEDGGTDDELEPDSDYGNHNPADGDDQAETSQPGEPPTPDELTRQMTFSTEGESDPLWSPDGRYLSFLSARPDPTVAAPEDEDEEAPAAQIWALPMDGGEARRITNTKEALLDYWWAPDGETLVYLALEPRPRPLESVHKDRQHRKFDPIVEHDDPRRRQFWSISVEERKPHLLFTADYGVESFALSPDGERVAYLTNYTGEENDYHIADLYLRDLETGATVKLLRRDGGKYRLRWSPSGARIAFLSWHDPGLSYSRESVYTVSVPSREEMSEIAKSDGGQRIAQGSSHSQLLHDIRSARARIEAPGIAECRQVSSLDTDITCFEWLDDDAHILALAATGTTTQLFGLVSEPRLPTPLSEAERGANAPHPPTPLSEAERGAILPLTLSPSNPLTEDPADRRDLAVHRETGSAAWVGESGTGGPEIVLRDEDGEEHVLTQLNASLAETYRLPRQEVVAWSAPDGRRIEGVLTYPLDYQAGTPAPLIVQVHGGPKGRATQTLLDYPMPAVWASEGYFVLRPNYRGSEGYGHEFAVANRRDLGGGDFADVMAGVDWAVAAGLADPERLGILGGSYGGYLVNWAIGHTDRFKAAISLFGIFHLQTDYSNSRLARWEHDYLGAYYWEDPEIYRRLSPATYLESIRTPALIIHGDEDDNTSIANSREVYRALLQRGVPTQFVHYPREGHGIQEPNHRLDELRRCLHWMDRFVRGSSLAPPVYRAGDKVPHAAGRFELCVTSAEIVSLIGCHAPPDAPDAISMLEVVLTLDSLDPSPQIEPLSVRLAEILLAVESDAAAGAPLVPIGVPLDMPGGKVLVQGDNLHITQQPDPETGELAFGVSAVFRVPKSGAGLLRVADFPPVAVNWKGEEETV